ncbi:hypothetical protein [Celeribacter arenosi]|uniref:Ferrochelatase n=1 Tax=Celeribacter arenosi TaxID=792649 RepID=A0ABP7KG00_9RHOB
MKFKKITGALAVAMMIAGSAHAGGYSEPVIDEPVMIEQGGSSSGGSNWVVPVLLLALIGVALASSDDAAAETDG